MRIKKVFDVIGKQPSERDFYAQDLTDHLDADETLEIESVTARDSDGEDCTDAVLGDGVTPDSDDVVPAAPAIDGAKLVFWHRRDMAVGRYKLTAVLTTSLDRVLETEQMIVVVEA